MWLYSVEYEFCEVGCFMRIHLCIACTARRWCGEDICFEC